MAYSLPLSALDLHRLIEQDVQRGGFYIYDDLETEEIDLKINEQQFAVIDGILDKYFGRTLKIGQEQGFQANQVSLDNLRKQHIKDAATTLTTATDIGVKFNLPDGYYHYLKAKATVSYSCYENGVATTKTKSVKLRIGETQNIDDMLANPLHRTVKESPLAEIAGNTVYVYTNTDFTVTAVKLDYIKKPEKFLYAKDGSGNYDSGNSVGLDIDDSLQYLVKNMTVIVIMKIIEGPQQKIVNLEQHTT